MAWLPPLSNVQNGRIIGYKIFYDYDYDKLSESMPLKGIEKVLGQDARVNISFQCFSSFRFIHQLKKYACMHACYVIILYI